MLYIALNMKRFLLICVSLLLATFSLAQNGGSRAPSSMSTTWYANAVFYQVFVRSFQDSNGDGIGDLKGLETRLADLQRLGVTALWLNPINPSPSYHGYDVTDYTGVNKDFGGIEDFKALMTAAHSRGMKVVLDFVPNHTSSQHPWFLESLNPSSPKRDWYNWRDSDPNWKNPLGNSSNPWHGRSGAFYYAPFWGEMPDLNWRNPEVKSAMFTAAKTWLERGADGFRVDAVRYLFEGDKGDSSDAAPDQPESIAWVKDFSQFVKSVKSDAAVVTEAWADTATVGKYFVGGQGQQLGFNFDLQRAIRDSANAARPAAIQSVLERVAANYPTSAVDAIFAGNHDITRMKFFNAGRYRSAAALLLTLPGTPFIYYGEEIGMPNGPSAKDEDKRTPMRWDATPNAGFSSAKAWYGFSTDDPQISVSAQLEQRGSLYNLYRNLIRTRQGSEALRVGGYAPLQSSNERVFSFLRSIGSKRVAVVINLDSDPVKLKLDLSQLGAGTVKELTLEKTLTPLTTANAPRYPVSLNGYGFVLLSITAP